MPVSEMDLKWNSSSTQVAVTDIKRGGSTALYAIRGNSVTDVLRSGVQAPGLSSDGTRIKRQPTEH